MEVDGKKTDQINDHLTFPIRSFYVLRVLVSGLSPVELDLNKIPIRLTHNLQILHTKYTTAWILN